MEEEDTGICFLFEFVRVVKLVNDDGLEIFLFDVNFGKIVMEFCCKNIGFI